MMTLKRSTILVSGLLFLIIGLSVLFYLLFSYPRVERVFFFPKDQMLTRDGELRRIPRHRGDEENVKEYMEEWLLGPLVLENDRLFPQGTRLQTILLRNNTLYLDFSFEILQKEDGIPLTFMEILDMTTSGIIYNFPQIQNIYFFVEGEPVKQGMEESPINEDSSAISNN